MREDLHVGVVVEDPEGIVVDVTAGTGQWPGGGV
jgi:hypothetical protein